jgi:hypothetical protein
MEKYIIELTIDQLNAVMKGLGELPLKESLPTFNEINNQYISQKQRDKSNKEASDGS